MQSPATRWLAPLGIVLVALFAAMVASGDLSRAIPRFFAIYCAGFVVYVAAVWMLSRREDATRSELWVIFVVAIACRLILLPAPPSLSTDVYRYLWEGRAVLEGHNPFTLAPEAPELVPLRDENYEPIGQKHLTTIYPPLAQVAFAGGAAVHAGVLGPKLVFVVFDLATLFVLCQILRRGRRNPGLCAVYGWSPLVIVEFAHSGHVDSLGIFLLVLAIWLLGGTGRAGGVVTAAASFLAKYMGAVLLPYFAARRRLAAWLPLFALVVALGYLPFASAGRGLTASLGVYGERWEFNGFVFWLLDRVIDHPRELRIGLLALLGGFVWIQAVRTEEVTRYLYLVIGCGLLLSPTLYPWYVCWLVPFLCIYRSVAWLVFTALVAASYWVWVPYHSTGQWQLPDVMLWIEYLPFFTLLLIGAARWFRTGHREA